jgi:hypothetical protein
MAKVEEGRIRLRAILRASLSPAVWLAIGLQFAYAMYSLVMRPEGESANTISMGDVFAFFAYLLIALYLKGGILQVLSVTRDPVSLPKALSAAGGVFPNLLFLVAKATGLVVLSVMFLSMAFSLFHTPADTEGLVSTMYPLLLAASVLLPLIFAYWLPWVFIKQDFLLINSLQAALQIGWLRIRYVVFLALLLLTPSLVIVLTGKSLSPLVTVLVSTVGTWFFWIALVYGIEVLQHEKPVKSSTKTA